MFYSSTVHGRKQIHGSESDSSAGPDDVIICAVLYFITRDS